MKLRNLVLASSILVAAGLVVAAYAQKTGDARSASAKTTRGERESDGARVIRARANWFYQQRAYPLKHIPAFARERAWQAFRQMQQGQRQVLQQKYGANYSRPAAAAALAASLVNTAAQWVSIGPKPTNDYFFQPYDSGRVTALAVDPCDSTGNTVFLGGAQGGLWKTTNGGTSWTPLTDQAPSLAVGSLAVPPSPTCVGTPSTSNTVYVGTGEENFSIDSYYGAGVLKCTTTDGNTYACTPDQKLGGFNAQSQPLTQDSGGPFIGGLAIDPQNPQIMLAAVQGSGSTLQSGVWCSADAGTNWTHVLPSVTHVVSTGVAFDQAGYAYAALGNIDGGAGTGTTTVNGVYKSGAALTTACSPGFTQLGALGNLAAPSTMGRVAISVASNPNSPTNASADEVFAVVAKASDTSSTLLGVFGSGNGGTNWTQLTGQLVNNANGFCNDQCFYDLVVTIDPHNPNVVYAGGSAPGSGSNGEGNTIIASTNASTTGSSSFTINAGSTWTDISNNSCNTCNSGLHVDAHAIAFAPAGSSGAATKVYVGTDGGAWSNTTPQSPTSSQTWANLNLTLALTQFYAGLSNNPAGWQYRTFGGAQDNGMQVLGPDLTNPSGSANAWSDTLACGDGGVTLVDPSTPSTVYGECAYIPSFLLGIEKSVFNGNADDANGNTTFSEFSNGINPTDDGSFIPPMAIDPTNTQNVYFGTYRVWQSTNSANSWNAISPDVTGASSVSGCSGSVGFCDLTAIAVAPTNSNEVVTGSSVGYAYLSENAGQGANATWTNITASPLPPRAITHVAVDPSSANTLYATFSGFSGFNGDTAGHVFLGNVVSGPSVSWIDISSGAGCTSPAGNLPNIPVNDIIVDPDHAGQLFVGTDVGVYVGTLQGTPPAVTGACWQPLGAGLPNSAVLSLSLNDASRTLIAGTHGRSSWALALGDQPAFSLGGLSPASAAAGGSQFTMTLTGTGFTAGSTVNWTPTGGTSTSLAQTSATGCATPTCIAVQVPGSLLGSGSVAQVSVSDTTQTPNTTNLLPFTVTSSVPTVTQISPVTGTVGNSVALTMTGTNFSSTASISLDQLIPVPCSPVTPATQNATQLTATIPGNCLQYGGIFFVTANNPQPGGGSSNPNQIAATSPYGTACTSMNPPGCLLTVTGPAPSNDSFSSPTAAGSNTYTTTEDTSGASASSSDPALPSGCTSGAASNGVAKSVWFKYTPTSNVTAEVDTIGSSYDTILSAWTNPSASGDVAPLPFTPARPPLFLIVGFILTIFFLVFAFRRRRPFSRRFATALSLALLAGALAFQGACGGGSSSGGGPTPPPTTGGFNPIGCNDDIVSGLDRVSQLTNLSLSANTTYYFMVSDWGVAIQNGSGNITSVLPSGGKLVFNLNAK